MGTRRRPSPAAFNVFAESRLERIATQFFTKKTRIAIQIFTKNLLYRIDPVIYTKSPNIFRNGPSAMTADGLPSPRGSGDCRAASPSRSDLHPSFPSSLPYRIRLPPPLPSSIVVGAGRWPVASRRAGRPWFGAAVLARRSESAPDGNQFLGISLFCENLESDLLQFGVNSPCRAAVRIRSSYAFDFYAFPASYKYH
ncbi:hypothetical protein SEVIR_7G262701v4 [Setaria viridis]